MENSILAFLIVCPCVFLASFADAIAGGGGLISLPAYMIAGLPIHSAIGTNKLSSSIGTLFSTARLLKNKYADFKIALPSIIFSLTGSVIGANIALHTSEKNLQLLMILVLPVVAYYVLKKKDMEPEKPYSLSVPVQYTVILISAFFLGMYDGFYGPGAGTFALLALTQLARMDIRTAAGNVKMINLASNIAALVTYLMAGKIYWTLGLVASIFSIAGHYIGAGLIMKDGTKIVRPVIIVVMVLLFIKVIYGFVS